MQKLKKFATLCKKVLRVVIVWLFTELLFAVIDTIIFSENGQGSTEHTIFAFAALIVPVVIAILSIKVNLRGTIRRRKKDVVIAEPPIQTEPTSATPDIESRGIKHAVKGTVADPVGQKIEDNNASDGLSAELKSIDSMTDCDFKYWTVYLLQDMGFSDVEATHESNSQGVDVLAQKGGIKYAIQCKCHLESLGNKPIQEVRSGKSIYHCQMGVVITNQYFTSNAKELAEATGVLLWDRDWIISALTVPPIANLEFTPAEVHGLSENKEKKGDYSHDLSKVR